MFVTLNVSPRNFIRTIKHQTWSLEILPQAGDFDRVRQMVEERPELVSLASGGRVVSGKLDVSSFTPQEN